MLTVKAEQINAMSENRETEFKVRLRFFLQEQLADAGPDNAKLPIDEAIERVLSTAESIGATSEGNAASCVILYLLAHCGENSSGNIAAVNKILSETIDPIEKRIENCSKIFE